MTGRFIRARDRGLAGCHICGGIVNLHNHEHRCCPRCGAEVHYRKHNSISRTWALLISAFIMYIPANTEPIMRTVSLGQESTNTIISGVIYFLQHNEWPLALVIFLASV